MYPDDGVVKRQRDKISLEDIENNKLKWCREGELNPHEVAFDGF